MTDPEVRKALQALHAAREATERLNERHALEIAHIPALETARNEDRALIDAVIAWIHGGPIPKLTPGAQAIKTLKGTSNDPF